MPSTTGNLPQAAVDLVNEQLECLLRGPLPANLDPGAHARTGEHPAEGCAATTTVQGCRHGRGNGALQRQNSVTVGRVHQMRVPQRLRQIDDTDVLHRVQVHVVVHDPQRSGSDSVRHGTSPHS